MRNVIFVERGFLLTSYFSNHQHFKWFPENRSSDQFVVQTNEQTNCSWFVIAKLILPSGIVFLHKQLVTAGHYSFHSNIDSNTIIALRSLRKSFKEIKILSLLNTEWEYTNSKDLFPSIKITFLFYQLNCSSIINGHQMLNNVPSWV